MFRFIFLMLLSISVKGQDVYKTPYGEKYHVADCKSVRNVSEKIKLLEAGELGLTPCKICKPVFVASVTQKRKTPTGEGIRVQCRGTTKAGNRCRNMTKIGNSYCYHHEP